MINMEDNNKSRDAFNIINHRLHKMSTQMNDIEEKQNRYMSENTSTVREILTNTTIRSHENEREIKNHIDKDAFKIEQSIQELSRVLCVGFVLILITQVLMLFAMMNFYRESALLQKETQSHNANSVEESTSIPK